MKRRDEECTWVVERACVSADSSRGTKVWLAVGFDVYVLDWQALKVSRLCNVTNFNSINQCAGIWQDGLKCRIWSVASLYRIVVSNRIKTLFYLCFLFLFIKCGSCLTFWNMLKQKRTARHQESGFSSVRESREMYTNHHDFQSKLQYLSVIGDNVWTMVEESWSECSIGSFILLSFHL